MTTEPTTAIAAAAQLNAESQPEREGAVPPPGGEQPESGSPVPDAFRMNQPTNWERFTAFLCARNPFYLISALLILYAQSALFTADPLMARTEIPLGILAGYTALLAAAGVLIVRAARAWDDVRSVLLLCVMAAIAATGGTIPPVWWSAVACCLPGSSSTCPR